MGCIPGGKVMHFVGGIHTMILHQRYPQPVYRNPNPPLDLNNSFVPLFIMHHHKFNYLLLASSTFCARPTPPYRTTSPKPARSKDRKSKSFRSRTPEHQTRDTRPNVILLLTSPLTLLDKLVAGKLSRF